MRTLQDMTAAVDRVLPLCEAVANAPHDLDGRQALTPALAAIADPSFLEPCQEVEPELRGLCNFVHIQATLLSDCLRRSDAPDHFMKFMIGGKSRDLLALLSELKTAFDRCLAGGEQLGRAGNNGNSGRSR